MTIEEILTSDTKRDESFSLYAKGKAQGYGHRSTLANEVLRLHRDLARHRASLRIAIAQRDAAAAALANAIPGVTEAMREYATTTQIEAANAVILAALTSQEKP